VYNLNETLDMYFKNPSGVVDYSHTKTNTYTGMDFHLHEFFEIYFFISGKVNYFIENKVYKLKYGDLIIMNNHEIHRPSVFSGEPYERIVIHFNPSIARLFKSPNLDLLSCFTKRPKGEFNIVHPNDSEINEILYLLSRIEFFNASNNTGSNILKLTTFIELLVSINRIYKAVENIDEYSKIPEKLTSIIEFIDKNSEKNLSLQALSRKFYIDKYYLSRLFKKHTGSNIHEYILYKRISKAKYLLSKGYSATDTAIMCGFNDYSNFYRMFRKTVGVTPSSYMKKHGI
jgi:AraC-like DNA-binding protein